MIQLPPGCRVNYEITITVRELTDDIGHWFVLQGGNAWLTEVYDHRGRKQQTRHVQLGSAKPSYHMKDGTGHILLRIPGSAASLASMFLLKFMDQVESHNMQETMDRYEREG
jgi:hypothetical protein